MRISVSVSTQWADWGRLRGQCPRRDAGRPNERSGPKAAPDFRDDVSNGLIWLFPIRRVA